MYPAIHAAINPDKIAAQIAHTDTKLTYAELEERSTRLANAFADAGLQRGDVVALLSTNHVRIFEVYWACLRSGMYLTPVNFHLSADEVAYIVDDCGATALIVSGDLGPVAQLVADSTPQVKIRMSYEGAVPGFGDYEEVLAAGSPVARESQPRGADMIYSSGTTGRPKGVKPPLPDRQVGDAGDPYVGAFGSSYAMGSETVYFSPAPLYHAAPLRFGMITQSLGGTVLLAQKFDAEECLRTVHDYRVTHTQWVPTHFVRMLRLPAEIREKYDVSSLTHAVHAAAPCPVEVKRQMIDWFGPILYEYYGSTEGNGITMIGSDEWVERPGSVGTAKLGTIHVCSDDGLERPTGEAGVVFFERDIVPFVYHNDQEKTLSAQHPEHETWSTCGDIGYVDADGYLFLLDRKAFTIISGGVNIYPQEIEDCLALHPYVHDVAVIGVPDAEYGESVMAVVQTAAGVEPSDEVADELTKYVRSKIAGYKVPRSIEFVDELPRTPTGKLVKRHLRDKFVSENA
ncbi:acyl-CoA synthetase [Gordonia lacunae]|uniref:acyl-CoA synthetase n=1 Tax=Gordonia lacunae TaxID=417102 RepID=UPI0039E56635